MKRKAAILLFVSALSISACNASLDTKAASSTTSAEIQTVETSRSVEETTTLTETANNAQLTEIIYSALIFDKSQTIDNYVDDYNQKNPDNKATVYDDTHYSIMMPEKERIELVKAMGESGIDEYLGKFITDEKYDGYFTTYSYDENLQHIKFYVDSTRSKNIGYFELVISSSLLSDTYQALKLVPVDQRAYNFEIIDESGNIIYPE